MKYELKEQYQAARANEPVNGTIAPLRVVFSAGKIVEGITDTKSNSLFTTAGGKMPDFGGGSPYTIPFDFLKPVTAPTDATSTTKKTIFNDGTAASVSTFTKILVASLIVIIAGALYYSFTNKTT